MRNAEDYRAHLQALLPTGQAWPRDVDSVLARLLHALAGELARVDDRAADLAREADPRAAFELLVEWESAFGLPDDCTSADARDTLAERRTALEERVTAIGGVTPQYLIDLAAALGFAVTITEIRPSIFGRDDFGSEFIPEDAIFTFEVMGEATTVVEAVFGNATFGEPFGGFAENAALECAIRRAAPAHAIPYFNYGV